MSDKLTCPACDAYTSSVAAAYRDGDPCPYCALPWDTMFSVFYTQSKSELRIRLARWFADRRLGRKDSHPTEEDFELAMALVGSGLIQPA